MTTSDTIALYAAIIALAGVIVFIVQSFLLYWYANETKKLRVDANAQTVLFTEQVKTSVKQNELMAQQLEAMTKAHQLQVELVEAAETVELNFRVVGNHNGYLTVKMESLNLNVYLVELRSNVPDLNTNYFDGEGNTQFRLLFQRAMQGVVYFGVKYRTKRGQYKTAAYAFNLQDGVVRLEKGYDINLLEDSNFRFVR